MVTLYYTDIRALAPVYDTALARVTPARQRRIAALRRPEDRLRSLGAGLLLHTVLGIRNDSQLARSARGKPLLPDGPQISLSHSGNLAVLAVSTQPVGTDVQRIAPVQPKLVRYVCTPEELRWLQTGADPARRFAVLWTRKESVMKATGLGLGLRPASLCVLPEVGPLDAEGVLWYPTHQELDGHMLAAAAPEPAQPVLCRMDLAQLFSF